ncbi:MAG TPA: tRNA pseudouridine(38-40) synthase TruA [Symbiobacteriaceae bacterium]
MRTIKLTLQYDGTHYAGFQRQPNGVTIQEKLEEALRKVTGNPDLRIGGAAGRTDAGVHARGQVVHFRTDSRIPTDRWPYALNSHLPPDIAVVAAEEVPEGFHARFWARWKRYRYTIQCGPFPLPLYRLYAYHWRYPVDVERMAEAAALLVGRHDFAAFRSTGGSAKTSVRTIFDLKVTVQEPLILVDVTADGFLYNMVRIIAGTLVEVGSGLRSLDQVREALATGNRDLAGRTLPARGLCLEEVGYGDGPVRPFRNTPPEAGSCQGTHSLTVLP